MSLETRSSALFKRAEQIKRWEESETNREPVLSSGRERKIKFSAGCVFLAACKAGDKEEILRLLKKSADIDTTDVDGLSALHQVRCEISQLKSYCRIPSPNDLSLGNFLRILKLIFTFLQSAKSSTQIQIECLFWQIPLW